MQLAVSSALVAHRVGLPEVTDGFVRRRDIQALPERVAIDIVLVITTHPESD